MGDFGLYGWGVAVALVVAVAARLYGYLWRGVLHRSGTPSGFGVFIPWVATAFLWARGHGALEVVAMALIGVFTVIYWLDDIKGLSAKTRLAVSFVAGGALGMAAVIDGGSAPLPTPALVVAAGISCVVLTNIINFYDGADLNLATFAALLGVLMWVGAPSPDGATAALGVAMAGFALGFGFINRKPMSVYLGDAGSFGLAAIVTYVAVLHFAGRLDAGIQPLAALALPAFDVFYVLVIRLTHGHDLLSRNYLHLYQRLQILHGGRFYLLPQFVSAIVVLGVFAGLKRAGLGAELAMVLSCAVVVPPLYLLARRLFIEPSYVFGDGRAG
jgi:UDP-N-acetylmuramyl pentapeptide phosphotransferase/UDP-N-acetylglucosamine-1-phosphate transferase